MNRLLLSAFALCLLYFPATMQAQSYLPLTGGTLSGPLQIQYNSSNEYILQHLDGLNNVLFGFKRGSSANANDLLIRAYNGIGLSGNNSETIGFYMNTSGNVGIGTTTPAYKLQVAGSIVANGDNLSGTLNGGFYGGFLSTTGYAKIIGSSSGAALIDFTKDNQDIAAAPYFNGRINYDFTVDAMSFAVNSAERMRIDASGNVGIGTAAPGPYKLAVEGTIGARKIKVTLANPWADYVFDSSYRLKPLAQVAQYIKDNKHLPEVPTAEEVKKDGIDVGDNQALLLKKIEELTLYIINQQKQIDALTETVKQLKKP